MDLIIFLLNKNVQIEIVCILNDHPVSALLKEALQRPETDLKRRFIKLLKELFARSKEKKLCITFSRLHDHQTLEDVSVWLVRGIHRNVCPYLMTVAPVFFIFSDPTYDGGSQHWLEKSSLSLRAKTFKIHDFIWEISSSEPNVTKS